jgi:hypothetical protein
MQKTYEKKKILIFLRVFWSGCVLFTCGFGLAWQLGKGRSNLLRSVRPVFILPAGRSFDKTG